MYGLLFVAALAALGGAAWRAAGACGLDGAARAVGAAALAAGAATVQALALGAVGAATAWPLGAAAAATWLLALRLWPARGRTPGAALRGWWEDAPRRERLAGGALGAVVLAWVLWQAQHPNLGFDGLIYHGAIAALWAQEGTTGSVVQVAHGLPVGNYPLATEAGLAWALAVSRSLVLASVWTPVLWVVLTSAIVTGLRALDVPRPRAWLAAAAFATLPIVVTQLRGPYTDVAAVTWLAAALALCALAARGRSLALAPALVAAGLAIGAKPTTAVFALAAVAWVARREWPAARHRGVVAAGAAGLLLAGLWPLRNLIEHGAPLWPLTTNPGGDPIPPAFEAVDDRFLDRAGDLLSDHLPAYAEVLGGGWLLVLGGIILGAVAGGRGARIAALATIAGLLLWTVAPYTGIEREDLAAGATRYLLPTVLAGTVALALAGRAGAVALASAVALSLIAIVSSFAGFHDTPNGGWLTLVALLGAGAAALAARRRPGGRRLPARIAWPLAGLVAAWWIVAASAGYTLRHTSAVEAEARTAVSVATLVIGDPRLRDGQEIATYPITYAIFAGDRLQHPLSAIPADAACEAIRARRERGWVVLRPGDTQGRRLAECLAGAKPINRNSGWLVWPPVG